MNKLNLMKYLIICAGALMLLTTSCVPFSKIKYFNDINQLNEPIANPMSSIKISPFDKLRVLVLSTDQETSAILNYSTGQSVTTGPSISYVVDASGYITFPFAGKIQVGGLTLVEAGETISNAINTIITNPEVYVYLIDPKITLIGEVYSQGSYIMSKEFLNVYEAMALGGGLSQYANRKNVILLRNENNKLTHYILDLSNSKITSSPLFYILPNDVIIVEPLRNKSWNMQSSTWMTILSSISSLLSIYYLTSFTMRY
jgi:polysaccharide export outer membrane protein